MNLVFAACASEFVPPRVDSCEELADVYEVVARSKDLGMTKAEALDRLGFSGSSASDTVYRQFAVHALDLAYQYPEADSKDIRALVFSDCELDEAGDATLKSLWP